MSDLDGPPERGGPGPWGQPDGAPPSPAAPEGPPPSVWQRFTEHFHEAPVTVSLVVITVGMYLLHIGLQHWAGINTDVPLQDNGTALHGQYWRLLSPLLVHYSVYHIGFNMLALWTIGTPVEKVIGRSEYFLSYLVCGVAGDALSDLLLKPYTVNGIHYEPVAGGASGAIFGIVGLLIGNYLAVSHLDRRGRRSTQQWRFTSSAAKSLAIQGTVWIVLSSLFIKNIDNWAHLGGAACGLVIGGAVGWSRSVPADDH